jgi:hypothetical protein
MNDSFIYASSNKSLKLQMSIAWENNTTNETQEFSIDPLINRKIKTAVQALQKSVQNYFLEFARRGIKNQSLTF